MGAIDDSRLLRRHRITVDEYHRLGEAGVLVPDARVELIDGDVIDMAPIGSRHWSVVTASPGASGIRALPGVSIDLAGLFG